MERAIGFSFLICLSLFSIAQDTLNTKFHFTDGIYLSLNSFVSNTPDHTLKQVVLKETERSEYSFKEINVKFISPDSAAQSIKPQQIWGICIVGIPFINSHHFGEAPKKEKEKSEKHEHYCYYSRLWMIGDICFFR